MKIDVNFPEDIVNIFETPKGKSETIPNRALHIGEIMARSLRGSILSEVENNRLEYGDDEDFDDAFEGEVDLTDLEETHDNLSYLEARVEQAKKAKKQASINPSETEQKTHSEELSSPNAE